MRRWLIGLVVVLTLPLATWAQAAPKIEWQHDGVGVTHFECVVDGTTTTSLGMGTLADGWYSSTLSNCTGVMVVGTHQVVVQACNVTGCTAAAAMTVVKL